MYPALQKKHTFSMVRPPGDRNGWRSHMYLETTLKGCVRTSESIIEQSTRLTEVKHGVADELESVVAHPLSASEGRSVSLALHHVSFARRNGETTRRRTRACPSKSGLPIGDPTISSNAWTVP